MGIRKIHFLAFILSLLIFNNATSQKIMKVVNKDRVEKYFLESDISNNNAFISSLNKFLEVVLPQDNKISFGKSVALLVGVSSYNNLTPNLPYVANDLEDMKEYLLRMGGFDEVYVIKDALASRDLVELYIKKILPDKVGTDGRLLFYFSGHGDDPPTGGRSGYMQFKSAIKDNFLGNQVLKMNDIFDWSKELEVSHFIAILDCCSSGLAFNSKGDDGDDYVKLMNTFSQNGSRTVITAGTNSEETFEVGSGTKGNGVFTRSLLNALETGRADISKDGIITTQEIMAEVRNEIANFSIQYNKKVTPRMWEIEVSDYPGTFIFVNPKAQEMNIALTSDLQQKLNLISKKGEEKSINELFELAKKSREKSPYLAISKLDEIIAIDSMFDMAYIERAALQIELTNIDDAIADLTKASALGNKTSDLFLNFGKAYYAQENYSNAIENFDQSINLDTTNIMAFFQRAKSYVRLNQFEKAIDDCNKILSLNSNFIDAHLLKGDILFNRNQYQEALSSYQNAVDIDKINKEYLLKLAKAEHKIDSIRDALVTLKKIIDLDSTFYEAYLEQAIILLALNEKKKAEEGFKKVIQYDPDNTVAIVFLSELWLQLYHLSDVIKLTTKGLSKEPENTKLLEIRGDAYFKQSNYSFAMADYTSAIRSEPSNAVLYKKRSDIFRLQGLIEESRQDELRYRKYSSDHNKVGLVLTDAVGYNGLGYLGVLKFLEEQNIIPDYIVGSGGGAVVGALYALGYSTKEISEFLFSIDHEQLGDGRGEYTLGDKDTYKSAQISFDLKYGGLSFSDPVNQSFLFELSKRTLEAGNNFGEYKIPFAVVLTDVEDGYKQKVISSGNLQEVLEASISYVFLSKPVRVGEKMYYDGNWSAGLPVRYVREMGADIVIRVGVKKNENEELYDVFDLVSNYTNNFKSQDKALSDIAIDVEFLGQYDFFQKQDIDSSYLASVRKASEILKKTTTSEKQVIFDLKSSNLDSIYVDEIIFRGLDRLNENFLLDMLDLETPAYYSIDMIKKCIDRIYGNRLVETMSYSVNNNQLVINVTERSQAKFGIGVNFNTDYRMSFYLGMFTSVLGNTKAKLKLAFIGNDEYPNALFNYTHYNNRLLKTNIESSIGVSQINDPSTDYTYMFNRMFAEINGMSHGFKLGIEQQNIRVNEVGTEGIEKNWLTALAPFVSYSFDTRNDLFYTARGTYAKLEHKYLFRRKGLADTTNQSSFHNLNLTLQRTTSLSRNLRFTLGIESGFNFTSHSLIPVYRYYLGGMSPRFMGNVPFAGYQLQDHVTSNFFTFNFKSQVKLAGNHYIEFFSTNGLLNDDYSKLFKESDDFLVGYGIGYSYKTSFGPLYIAILKNNLDDGLGVFVNFLSR